MSHFMPTIVNAVTVIIGSCVGLWLHRILHERFRELIFQALGLVTILIGLRDALGSQQIPIIAFSLILGGLFGEALNIEMQMERLGAWFHQFIKHGDGNFINGFVYASLLFCIGGMTIVGSLQAGINADGEILYTKALMDGMAAIFLAGAMGLGVMFSSVTILLVQGSLTFIFYFAGNQIPESIVKELAAVGGLMIVAIGLNLLGIIKIRIGNLLPALLFVYIFLWIKLSM